LNNFLENTYFINPAAIDDEASTTYSMVARKQWFGFPGAPATYFTSATNYINKYNTQIGCKIFDDKIGFTNTFNIAISYAYSVRLLSDWNLHLGLAASFQSLSYDLTDVNSTIVDDPTISSTLLKVNNFNSDLGIQLTNRHLTIGASSQNFFTLFFAENKLQTNTNFFYAKYRKQTYDPINLQLGVSGIQYNNMFQMEFNLTSYFKYYHQSDLFQVGLFYRTRSEMGALFGLNLGESLHLWYGVDFDVAGISRSSAGTHEIMLIYKFKNKYLRNY
jgi:type IX secretion system PorP/SprF family membrane protein